MHSCSRWVWLTTTLRSVRFVEAFEHQFDFGQLRFEHIEIDRKLALVFVRGVAHERPW